MEQIKITTIVNAPIEKIWTYWTDPAHIVEWNAASPDWHTTKASNDLREGGKFSSTMAAKDGSMSFDFEGTYSRVDQNKLIDYYIADGRAVSITFDSDGDAVTVTETFDPESQNPVEMQRDGWQAILDNFKKYVEGN